MIPNEDAKIIPDAYAGVRSSRRIPMTLTVTSEEEPVGTWKSLNLSEGGMFLNGAPVLAPGTPLRLRWSVVNGSGRFEMAATACVVWANDPESPKSDPRLPAGMGVEFRDLDGDSRRMLRTSLYGADTPGFSAPSAEEEMLAPGTVIGSYRILDLLGTGGMASVYLAEHLTLGRRVALKMMLRRYVADRDAVRRFFEEGRLVCRVRHDNVVEITDFVTEGTHKYYVMEFLVGETLADVRQRDGGLPAVQVAHIGRQLAAALQAVHDAGIVHRDLKPANVFLARRHGMDRFVKLLDFGVAKLADEASEALLKTEPGLIVGTPGYVAPEYSEGAEPDHRSDIYALGAILYELAAGRMVFRPGIDGKTWSDLMIKHVLVTPTRPIVVRPGEVPPVLDQLIMWCLEKNPEARPQSMAQVAELLTEIEAGRTPRLPRRLRAVGSRRGMWIGGAAAGVLGAAAVVLALWLGAGPTEAASSGSSLPPAPTPRVVSSAAVSPAVPPEEARVAAPVKSKVVSKAKSTSVVRASSKATKTTKTARSKRQRRLRRDRRSTLDPFAD